MNLEENNNFFRESFKGFNKDDVATFIAKLSKDYSDNEDKYKEHIAKLTADNRAKTEELNKLYTEFEKYSENSGGAESAVQLQELQELEEKEKKYREDAERLRADVNEKEEMINSLMQSLKDVSSSEKKYREEMNKLIDEVNEKSDIITEQYNTIEELKKSIGSANSASTAVSVISTEEMEMLRGKYSEILRVNEDLKRKIEENEKKLRESNGVSPDMINQLSAQLAISESEKLFLLSLLKKIINALGIEGINMQNISRASHIPENILKDIEDKLDVLSRFKERAVELEIEKESITAEKNELKDKLDRLSRNQPVSASSPQNEQKMYETITADLGSIIYSAKKSSEDIIAKAKNEAEDIIARANMKRLSILEENEKRLSEFKDKYLYLKKEHESVIIKYKEMSERYALRLSEVEESIDAVCKNI